jgi:nucleoside-diphosphate-sugar epimerase
MKVCVTGANGFVGSNLCKYMLDKGFSVSGLVRKSSDLTYIKELKKLQIFTGDITQPETLTEFMKDVGVLYSIAAYTNDWGTWETMKRVNIDGVQNVMESAKKAGAKRVVHISSTTVLGFPGGIDIEEDVEPVDMPDEPYVVSKRQGEKIALSYNSAEMGVVAIRPGTIYGPNDRTQMLRFLPELEKGKFPLVAKGKYLMTPIYIDNLMDLLLRAAESENAPGRVYNAGDEGKTTWGDFLCGLADAIGVKRPTLSFPKPIAVVAAALLGKFAKPSKSKKQPNITRFRILAVIKHNHYSIEKAKRELGYSPPVSTQEGIQQTARWYLDLKKRGEV